MPYKQPYKQVSKNDGASAVGAIATIGALIAKIGTAAKTAGAVAKTGATVAKGVKGAKAVSTGAKTVKTAKTASTTAKSAKGSKRLGKVSDAGKKALDKGKKVVEKGKDVVEKGKDAYDKGAEKIADATGFDKQNIKDFGTEKGQELKDAVSTKIQAGKESQEEEPTPAVQQAPYSRPSHEAQGSYANPQGPSMFDFRKDHGPSFGKNVNYANSNHGASLPADANNNNEDDKPVDENSNYLSSIDKFNLWSKTDPEQMWQSYSAPITIKGVTFDAADAIRLGIMGGKLIDKGIKKHKANKWAKEELKKKLASTTPGSGVLKSSINTSPANTLLNLGKYDVGPKLPNVKVPLKPTNVDNKKKKKKTT